MRLSASTARRALLALLAVGILGASTGVLHAAFTGSTSNPASSFTAKKIFPRDRVSSAWDVSDQADGTAADQSGPTAYADGRIDTTGAWSNAFAANRYLDFEPSGPLPGGLTVSSPAYEIRFSSSNAGTMCIYFEVIRRSTSAVLATYGSAGTPAACVTGTTYQTVSTPIPIVTTTDIANDLRIRVYGRHSSSSTMRLDRSVVTGSTPYTAFTLYSEHYTDAADTTGALISWGLPRAADGLDYPSQGSWATSFSATRYIRLTFEPFVPAGSVVNATGSFTHSYRAMNAGRTVCWYFETYNGTTLLAAHGSSGSPISCVTGNAAWQTDTTPIPEVNTVAEANNLVIRIYASVSGGNPRRSEHDRAVVTLNYHLD